MPTPSPPDPLVTRARATSEVNAGISAPSHAVHAVRSLAPLSLLSPLSVLTAVTVVTVVTVGHHHPERFVLLHCGVPRYAPLAALALVPIGSQRHTAENAPLAAHRPPTSTTRHLHFNQLRATGRSPSARCCRRRWNLPACRVRGPRIKPQTDTSHPPAPRDLRSRSPSNSNLDHRRTPTGPSERCRSAGTDPGLQLRNQSSETKVVWQGAPGGVRARRAPPCARWKKSHKQDTCVTGDTLSRHRETPFPSPAPMHPAPLCGELTSPRGNPAEKRLLPWRLSKVAGLVRVLLELNMAHVVIALACCCPRFSVSRAGHQ